jgi:hypothetical protein
MMHLRPTAAVTLSSLYVTVNELCASQDAALMQILSMAKLAKHGLNGDIEEASDHAGHVLDAIIQITAGALASLDAAQIEIDDARPRDHEGAKTLQCPHRRSRRSSHSERARIVPPAVRRDLSSAPASRQCPPSWRRWFRSAHKSNSSSGA